MKPRTAPPPPPVSGARWIALTQSKFALVDETDFERVNQFTWTYAVPKRPGLSGYAYRQVRTAAGAINYKLHQVILGIPLNSGVGIDHRDGNGLNNRRSNLRLATQTQNLQNACIRSNNTSGYKGVTWHEKSNAWHAVIKNNGKVVSLGYYHDPADAARAYNRAALDFFGEFARINEGVGVGPIRTGLRSDNKSGHRGVLRLDSGRWKARYGRLSLGIFDTVEEAAAVSAKYRKDHSMP